MVLFMLKIPDVQKVMPGMGLSEDGIPLTLLNPCDLP
jgi:hypothetical protein